MKRNRILNILGWCVFCIASGGHGLAMAQTVGQVDEVNPGERVVVVNGYTYSVDPLLILRPWSQRSERIEGKPLNHINEIRPGAWILFEANNDVIERLVIIDGDSIDQPAAVIEPPVWIR